MISVAAAVASGRTVIKDARELRVKETDRIKAMADNLRLAGVTVEEADDGMTVYGTEKFTAFHVESCGDHRIAMSMLVAGLVAAGPCTVDDTECIATSFPNFFALLEQVSR